MPIGGITFPGMFGISTEPYKAVLGHENEGLRLQNAYFYLDRIRPLLIQA